MTISTAQFNDLFRFCDDIGMFANDRPINDTENHTGSCDHRTPFCDDTCYNVKLYKMYPDMAKRDDRCETIWQSLGKHNVQGIKAWLERKRKQTKRVRHMTRGEAIKDVSMCIVFGRLHWLIQTPFGGCQLGHGAIRCLN